MAVSKRRQAAWKNFMSGDLAAPKRPKPASEPKGIEAPTEHAEQVAYVKWLILNNLFFYAIPNESNRSISQRMRHKAAGLISGIPDLMVCEPVAPFHGLYIEMKRTKGSVTSDRQVYCHAQLRKKGYAVFLAYGCADAIKITETYLKGLKNAVNDVKVSF